MEPEIIFEDKCLLVINKPAGWVVNDASTTKHKNTIQSWLAKNFDYELAKSVSDRGGMAHRLDKETSGLLLVAKDKETLRNIQAQFKARTVKKEYSALVHGIVGIRESVIRAPTGRLPWTRGRFGVVPGGRKAVTRYKVVSYYRVKKSIVSDKLLKDYGRKNVFCSLLSVYPRTGRTHQIRVHFKSIGHPVVSDELYAGRKTARADRKWCPRLFLHATSISIVHPVKNKRSTFHSAIASDLKSCLKTLSLHKE